MKFSILLFLFLFSGIGFCQTQRIEKYYFGKSGINTIISQPSGETIVVSTFNSRPSLIKKIAEQVFAYYMSHLADWQEKTTFTVDDAVVSGTFTVKRSEKLTAIDFFYEKVEWKNGLTEIYDPSKK
jgi:hypothetical protein